MKWIEDVTLLNAEMGGWLVAISLVCLILLALPHWRRPLRAAILGLSVLAFDAGLWYFVEKVWRGLPSPLSKTLYGWLGVALLSLVLALSAGKRKLRFFLVVTVTVCALLGSNLSMKPVASIGDLWGAHLPPTQNFDPKNLPPIEQDTKYPAGPIENWFTPPSDMPAKGRVFTAEIPGDKSGWSPRTANLYTPPAYGLPGTPPLPVLVLIHGVPGSPSDWLGVVSKNMDEFAAKHKGLAPIVVLPDASGGGANPLCSDTKIGKVATYLQDDVPTWISANLKADSRRTHRAIGGISYGATCALQVVNRRPDLFETVLSLSGEFAPTLGTVDRTIRNGFDGDVNAYRANNPLDLMKVNKYPSVQIHFVVGQDDPGRQGTQSVYQAAGRAGMTAEFDDSIPGSHHWQFWTAAFVKNVPWLMQRLGITA